MVSDAMVMASGSNFMMETTGGCWSGYRGGNRVWWLGWTIVLVERWRCKDLFRKGEEGVRMNKMQECD